MFNIKHILLFLILGISNGYSQNLVPNYSFENYTQCPDTSNNYSLNMATNWESAVINSTDFVHNCNLTIFNQIGILPHTGNGFAGFYTINGYNADYREYLQTLLSDTLKQDSCYYFECYLMLNKFSPSSTSKLGVLFSLYPITDGVGMFNSLVDTIPNIENTKFPLLDTVNWMRINGTYKATGNEIYMLFGSFYPDTLTDVIPGPTYDSLNPFNIVTYFWADDFTLKLIPSNIIYADAGNNQSIIQGDSVQIGNNPLSDAVYSWYPSAGLNDTTLENPIAKPTVTTTYYCIKDACNSQTIDSVTVTVQPNGVENYYNNKNFKIYPNPNNGTFNISHNLNEENYVLEIIDITGKVVYSQYLRIKKDNLIAVNTRQISEGIYFTIISNQKEIKYVSKISVTNN